MDVLKDYVSLILSVIALGGLIYNFVTSGAKEALTELAELRKTASEARKEFEAEWDAERSKRQQQADAIVARFQLVESRLLKMESDLTHLPDREQTHRLELAVERLTGRMETLDERLKPVAAISDRLQEFLLEQARK